ncbi:MAG: hypothetical protein WCT40_03230 [Candidatus Magasanikbacteria bacterium]
MPPLLKKILLIILLLVVAGLIAYALYYFFQKTTGGFGPRVAVQPGATTSGQFPTAGERPATTTTGPDGATQLPVAGNIPGVAPGYYRPEPVTKIVSDYASFSSVAKDSGLRYYNASDGKFYRRSADGSIDKLSDQTFYDVSKVTWGNTTNQAVLEYPDFSKILYDFDKEKQITVPKHWEEFSFSPTDDQIAAKSIGVAVENRWLVTMDTDGSHTKIVEPMGLNGDKVTVDWSPSRQTVAFSQTADPISGSQRRMILLVGLNHENFRGLVTEGWGFEEQWSPSGKRLLYSVWSDRSDLKPQLWITNAYGDDINTGRQDLKVNTWSKNCAFASEQILYCAVPRDLVKGAGLMPEIAADSLYDMVKIDTNTGLKTDIPLGGDYNINSIDYDSANNKIIFTDKNQSGVFQVNL